MSAISSNFTYAGANYSSAIYNQLPKSQTNTSTVSLSSNTSNDIYIPGTGGKFYEKFTIYTLSPGKSFNSLGGNFESTYYAVTLVATGVNTSNNNVSQNNNDGKLLTLSEIDPNEPGAFKIGGKWTLVEDFLKEHSTPKQTNNPQNNQITVEQPEEPILPDTSDAYPFILEDGPLTIYSMSEFKKVAPSTVEYVSLTRKQRLQLNENPGLIWSFSQDNKAFEGHDILNGIFNQVFTDVNSLQPVTDEYGYQYVVPGYYEVAENMCFGLAMPADEDGNLPQSIASVDTKIDDFGGLTLEERDLFWSEVQKMFNRYGIIFDARNEEYGYVSSDTPGCNTKFVEKGTWTWYNDTVDQLTLRAINKEIYDNKVISALLTKNEKVLKGEILDDTLAQQYSIRVTDKEGNALAKDQIIIESKNGNQLQMSVSDFVKLGRKEITTMLM